MAPHPPTATCRRVACALLLAIAVAGPACGRTGLSYRPRTRTYFVRAEVVRWNYMPAGYDSVTGQAPPHPWGDSLIYRKLRYIGYTDSTFTTRLPEPPWLGILGPMLRACTGDTIRVVFRNATDRPLSIHPHGVRYDPRNEGALYNPPRGGGDSVTPGGTYTYNWLAGRESGPLPSEPSTRVWLYHSHVHPEEEIEAGLVGVILVADPTRADPATALPTDVDREFVTFWMVFNENHPGSPPRDEEMNLKHAINGRFFGNLRGLVMHKGDRVRWYVTALGSDMDLHTPHWHGAKLLLDGTSYVDVIELLPGSMRLADMVARNPGVWMLHCHVNDHMAAGMYATYTITDEPR
jgi:FtsP/CotA-like multicopper oxidase with cupredoxin domain